MTRKHTDRLQLAVDFVMTRITRGSLRPGEFLPGVRALALAAGVSRETMWKAAQRLREQGVLSGDKGHRFRINGEVGSGDAAAPLPGIEKWRRVRASIQRDILNGIFQPDEILPPIKELSRRYSAARATLRRAFASLTEERLVMPVKGTYRVLPVTRSLHPHIRITAVGRADEMHWEYWHQEMYRYLDGQCRRANVGLSVFGFVEERGAVSYVSMPFREPANLPNTEETAGYVLHVTSPRAFHEDTARRLISYRKPIAVLDETGGWERPPFMKSSPYVHVFTMTTSRRAAWNVARYLLLRGHREAAFVAPYHKASWSVNRLEGVVSAFAEAGPESAVTARVFSQFASRSEFGDLGRLRSHVPDLVQAYGRWKGLLPATFTEHTDAAMHHLITVSCADGEIACQLEKVFEDLLRNPRITAWVMANDYSARMALRYLRGISVPVPGRISIVSFDDTPDAVEYGITSYNFNFPAVISAMIRCLLNSRSDRPGKPGQTTEIEGYIVERASCGRGPAKPPPTL